MNHNKFLRHALLSIAIVVVAEGCDSDKTAPDNACSNCKPLAYLNLDSVNILKGDAVRFNACDRSSIGCYGPSDTGKVITKWTVPDSSVLALVNGTSATLVPASTSVLVRGVASGMATLTAVFSTDSNSLVQKPLIRVADSSEIGSIELFVFDVSDSFGWGGFVPSSNTLNVGAVRYIQVRLRDVAGCCSHVFRGGATGLSSSDTTVLEVKGWPGDLPTILARKPGNATLTASFLSVTATRPLVVK